MFVVIPLGGWGHTDRVSGLLIFFHWAILTAQINEDDVSNNDRDEQYLAD